MAAANPDFNANEFRTQIRFAMELGTANTDPPTFHWEPVKTWAGKTSIDGEPLDWTATPATNVTRDPVQVPCAVQAVNSPRPGETDDTQLGSFRTDHVMLTFLDEDYAKVAGFDYVTLSGNIYDWVKKIPTIALFDVDVVQVLVQARDET